MATVRAAVTAVGAADINVLVTGETGTGKELAAEAIHAISHRRHHPLVRINCAAIPETLLESELFGHERGAFTGADTRTDGLLTTARGGTVFFDEIGDMTPIAQAKILRVIERKEVQRLGGRGSLPVDLRVLAATNRDVEQLVRQGQFRADLYFRLNVARVHLPSLADRKEDIPVLVGHFVEEFNHLTGRQVTGASDEFLDRLLRHDWPGNVRELRNVVESCFLTARSGPLQSIHVPDHFLRQAPAVHLTDRDRVIQALTSSRGDKTKAAAMLQWSRMTLYRRLAKYQLGLDDGAPARREPRH
jgi:DNA-binding NtrC family response regulator